MTRRSKHWAEDMQEDMHDPAFSSELLMAAVDNGAPLRQALGDIIRGIGVKEFGEKIGMSSPNVIRAIDPARNPTEETLERLLEPFELRLGLANVGRKKRYRRRPPRRVP